VAGLVLAVPHPPPPQRLIPRHGIRSARRYAVLNHWRKTTVPVPTAVTRFNKKYLNRFMIRLAGFGPFVEVEHVGRKSGTVRRTVIMAFRSGDVITIALTYGPGVDWLKNVRAAGGCRMHLGSRLLTLGPPSIVDTVEGLRRMPLGPKQILPILRSSDFVEMDILSEAPLPPHW